MRLRPDLLVFASSLSEIGFNDRFKDHYLVAPQSTASMLIMLAFTYIAPRSRRDVPLHAVHRVQLLLAALDAGADRG